jgi:hypothetical protein
MANLTGFPGFFARGWERNRERVDTTDRWGWVLPDPGRPDEFIGIVVDDARNLPGVDCHVEYFGHSADCLRQQMLDDGILAIAPWNIGMRRKRK